MPRRRVCVVTGSRADYGLLYWVMKELQQDPEFDLQVAVTGMHLSPEFGLTCRAVEEDGFAIHERVEMLLSGDSPTTVAKSVGIGVIGFADAFARARPDLVMLLGDRFEILAAAQAAMIANIPMSHLVGGDVTEGAVDDAIRHSITKMAHLHFVTNEAAARRVRQMGEDPERIFNVGSPGIDSIRRARLLGREELESKLGVRFRKRNFLVTFHCATLDPQPPAQQFRELGAALDRFDPAATLLLLTGSNADARGRALLAEIGAYVVAHENARCFPSLGTGQYLSLIAQVDVVIGNSSSGLYEVPSFHKPTVNIGDRQKGRVQADSVVNARPVAVEIVAAIEQALQKDCSQTVNPYGDGHSAERIVATLKTFPDWTMLLRKKFHEIHCHG